MNLPTGTITFLFTDIEGSTKLWDAHPQVMGASLRRHDSLMRQAIESNSGIIFKTVGDAFCAAFPTAPDALAATLAAQHALVSETWPEPIQIRVRMALHTGAAEERNGDYFGPPLNRMARLLSLGYGGQVLLSRSTQELVQDSVPPSTSLVDLGLHRLKDLQRPEHVYQLNYPDLPSEFPPLKSLDSLPTNLPQQLTSFIGRDQEIADVKSLLAKTRLLTLTGSGGCGKTRLALQVAAESLDDYADGVWLVELASLSDPALVAQTVAGVMGVREESGKPLVQTLQEFFKSKRMLLLLDNCEHLLDACAHLADTLLKSCPQVQILASSREGLGIAGEQTYRVPSLSLPSQPTPLTPESLSRYESVRLFIERASAVQPQFALTASNAAPLAQTCVHLDGIPLAIELAAARVRALSVEEINTRLDNRFRLLTGGSRTALPRHQTLRALIDWSYDLLNDQEKILLHRLSVFAGGWTLEAAGAVCAGEGIEDWEVVDLLTSLVDKSLVVAEVQEESTRYRLLETVRQYARDRLTASDESDAVQERHRDYVLALAEQTAPKLTGAEQGEWLQRLEEEHENLRSGLDWSLLEAGSSAGGLRLCVALRRFWWTRGHLSEGRAWCARALGKAGAQERTPERAKALNAAGVLADYQGDYSSARAYYEQSLEIFREIGDRLRIAHSLHNLGMVADYQGDYSSARAYYEQSLEIFREIGDRLRIAHSLHNLGMVANSQGDYASARTYHEQSLEIFREIEDRLGIAASLEAFAVLAVRKSTSEQAAALWGGAEALREEIGSPIPHNAREQYDRDVAEVRQDLGEEAFSAAWAKGRAMTMERAIAYALEEAGS